MSYWDTLPPTPKQQAAIESYEKYYSVEIECTTKQQAHDLISYYVANNKLDFGDVYVADTNIKYTVINGTWFYERKKQAAVHDPWQNTAALPRHVRPPANRYGHVSGIGGVVRFVPKHISAGRIRIYERPFLIFQFY